MSHSASETLPALVFRPLSLADLPAIMSIERESFSTPWRDTTFGGLILRDDTDVIGATRLGHLVAYAVAWTVGAQAELGNVAVASAERGRGTGRQMVERILDRLVGRGAEECFLEVRESNEVARALYEGMGFLLVGRRRRYYTRPVEDALVMRRPLV